MPSQILKNDWNASQRLHEKLTEAEVFSFCGSPNIPFVNNITAGSTMSKKDSRSWKSKKVKTIQNLPR